VWNLLSRITSDETTMEAVEVDKLRFLCGALEDRDLSI
jgi:hypothetical protein